MKDLGGILYNSETAYYPVYLKQYTNMLCDLEMNIFLGMGLIVHQYGILILNIHPIAWASNGDPDQTPMEWS